MLVAIVLERLCERRQGGLLCRIQMIATAGRPVDVESVNCCWPRFPRSREPIHRKRFFIILIAAARKKATRCAPLSQHRCPRCRCQHAATAYPCCFTHSTSWHSKQSCPRRRSPQRGASREKARSLPFLCAQQPAHSMLTATPRHLHPAPGASRLVHHVGGLVQNARNMNTVFDAWDRSQAVLRTRFPCGPALFFVGAVD